MKCTKLDASRNVANQASQTMNQIRLLLAGGWAGEAQFWRVRPIFFAATMIRRQGWRPKSFLRSLSKGEFLVLVDFPAH
jgi:hypothetical protein